MNQETFEQVPIAHDLIEGVDFLKEEMIVEVVSDASTETILFAELPVKVQLKVTYTEPGLKGDTATNATKPATVETGATVRVPLFINQDENYRSRYSRRFLRRSCKSLMLTDTEFQIKKKAVLDASGAAFFLCDAGL
mgnify:CR=1 FL=1